MATSASVGVAIVLVVLKAWATWQTGAVSVLASLVDSFLDSLTSLTSAVVVRYSLVPPDHDHRFGHGKAQALVGLLQAALIVASALFLIFAAYQRLRSPQPITALPLGLAVMLLSLGLTIALVTFQRHVYAQTGAIAIKGDAAHYVSDILGNALVLLALLATAAGWAIVDPVFALLIAAYIIWSAGSIAREAIAELMDRELPEAVQQQILHAAESVSGVHDVHDLRTRRSGHIDIIQMHVVLDDHLPVLDAHKIVDRVVEAVLEIRPGADILVHQDPLSTLN
ncbi:MAG: transporter [Lysobacteraceae bacterium]|nr:MAG: transporter [Xanthomonadaceae bacterium]